MDHLGVIHPGTFHVQQGMQAVCDMLRPPRRYALRRPEARARMQLVAARRPGRSMSERSQPADVQPDWARLIGAVALQRDRAAFASLFEYFAPRVKTFMRRSGASETAAEELAQETMLALWRKAALFDPATTGAASWIFTIARNLRIDALRRERRSSSNDIADVDAEFVLDDGPSPDTVLASTQADARIRSALSALSDEQLRVVELSFYQEKAHAEIAEVLGIPLGTVKSRLRLAMAKLRGLLGDLS